MKVMKAIGGALALLGVAARAVWPAAADTIPGTRPAPRAAAAGPSWTGCGVGVHVGRANADADFGAPINIGANGTMGGVSVLCDGNWDRFVLGLFAEYDRVWGDLHTLGVNSDITLGGRAGVLITQAALAYAHVAWSRVDAGSGLSNIDGIKIGAGIEVKIPDTPFSLDLRYTHAMYENVANSGIDVSADEARLGLNYRFTGLFAR